MDRSTETRNHRRATRKILNRRPYRRVAIIAIAAAAGIVGLVTARAAASSRQIAALRQSAIDSSRIKSNSQATDTTMKPPSVSTTTSTPKANDPLGAAASAYLSGRNDTVLAAVYDLNTNKLWTLGQGRPQAEASIVKVNILEVLLEQQGVHQILSASDQSLAQRMIEFSNNDAATALWNDASGAAGIQSFDTKIGLESTIPSTCVVCPGFPWPGWGLTTTIPADQIQLLRQLVGPDSLLTSQARSYILNLMENVTPSERWGITAGVAPQATVAVKNGWLPLTATDSNWQVNSIGWVSGVGRNYLIAVLTTGNPSEQYGIDTINVLSSLVWKTLG